MSMNIEGKYNIINNHANLKVLGKIPYSSVNVMGDIGNFSANQLVNKIDKEKRDIIKTITQSPIEQMMSTYITKKEYEKIPPLANNNKDTREFVVFIDGVLNSANSVKYFKWSIED